MFLLLSVVTLCLVGCDKPEDDPSQKLGEDVMTFEKAVQADFDYMTEIATQQLYFYETECVLNGNLDETAVG